MQSPSDETLMEQVRDNDLDQLSTLFERYQGLLFGFLLRLTNDRDTAQDLVQNVFLRILKYRTGYQSTGARYAGRQRRPRRTAGVCER